MEELNRSGLALAIKEFISKGKPFLGICVGMQVLFQGSEEDCEASGIGLLPGRFNKFSSLNKTVPHIGWSGVSSNELFGTSNSSLFYFVHSYKLPSFCGETLIEAGWEILEGQYREERFVAAVMRKNILITQFHPEKSGGEGLAFLGRFLMRVSKPCPKVVRSIPTSRIIACLDVREDDDGTLIVTKGDSYDVRANSTGTVKNVGEPVHMAQNYYEQGADEIVFLNITAFRKPPKENPAILQLLQEVSRTVFVPLTIGGGVTRVTCSDGTEQTALEVAKLYFGAGADKISIGSDAVYSAEAYWSSNGQLSGSSSIEQIAAEYGKQAVVISIDPKKSFVTGPEATRHKTFLADPPGVNGERYFWYQCTTKGGRELHDLDVGELAVAVQALGAGEILVNSIDNDGKNQGFDSVLLNYVKERVEIPVIASSGAGNPSHFVDVFKMAAVDAALGAGMFHRGEFTIHDVKRELLKAGLPVRM